MTPGIPTGAGSTWSPRNNSMKQKSFGAFYYAAVPPAPCAVRSFVRKLLAMLTDPPPRKPRLLAEFLRSDQMTELELPPDARLNITAAAIESAIKDGKRAAVRHACGDFLAAAAAFYNVQAPGVRALAARPLRVRESGWSTELFGDYTFETMQIRIWTRTAVRKQITSGGTFLSTLCHEFCHHLDCQRLGFRHSPHTRGFYARAAALYHHARGTPVKRLCWVRIPRGRWRIDWSRMNPPTPRVMSSEQSLAQLQFARASAGRVN